MLKFKARNLFWEEYPPLRARFTSNVFPTLPQMWLLRLSNESEDIKYCNRPSGYYRDAETNPTKEMNQTHFEALVFVF